VCAFYWPFFNNAVVTKVPACLRSIYKVFFIPSFFLFIEDGRLFLTIRRLRIQQKIQFVGGLPGGSPNHFL